MGPNLAGVDTAGHTGAGGGGTAAAAAAAAAAWDAGAAGAAACVEEEEAAARVALLGHLSYRRLRALVTNPCMKSAIAMFQTVKIQHEHTEDSRFVKCLTYAELRVVGGHLWHKLPSVKR